MKVKIENWDGVGEFSTIHKLAWLKTTSKKYGEKKQTIYNLMHSPSLFLVRFIATTSLMIVNKFLQIIRVRHDVFDVEKHTTDNLTPHGKEYTSKFLGERLHSARIPIRTVSRSASVAGAMEQK